MVEGFVEGHAERVADVVAHGSEQSEVTCWSQVISRAHFGAYWQAGKANNVDVSEAANPGEALKSVDGEGITFKPKSVILGRNGAAVDFFRVGLNEMVVTVSSAGSRKAFWADVSYKVQGLSGAVRRALTL